MDLKKILDEKVAQMVDDGTIADAASKALENAVIKAITDEFTSYNGFRKQIEEVVKAGLKIDLSAISFATYNEQMLVAVNQRLANGFHAQALERFYSEIDALLKPAPSEITFKGFIKALVNLRLARSGEDFDEEGRVVVKVQSSWKESSRVTVSFPDKSDAIEFYFIGEKLRIRHGYYYNPYVFDPVEVYIFKLYAAGTRITGERESFTEYAGDLLD